ncbi:lactate dehydrogenase [Aliidongia dinghuensis]|uniref:Lactate dehydrogenase n=1 Tax=Aliidongia dinghuensis TaxID=1867774 RepID=A0A8J2Z192_9PROT|nr:Ldh family oxidoreductase [Aliidongia dinghuensis]GGF49186.1 lactate dehydrogenase [Aliidongia dinghuensis]
MTGIAERIEALEGQAAIMVAELAAITADLLAATGMPAKAAAAAADILAECQHRGIDSHGVAHLPVYVRRLLAGGIDAGAVPAVVASGPAVTVLDGRNALGVLVGLAATDEACRRAREYGVGACAVRNSNHFGAAAPLVDRAARQGLVMLACSNAAPTMAPWGGREAMLGTNPLSAAFPRAGAEPVVIDMATSAASRSKLRQAALKKQPIPLDWALDKTGVPTSDGEAALAGTMQPLGGAKGYALTLMVELLSTTLSAGKSGFEVANPYDSPATPAGTSHFFVAFDPRFFSGLEVAEETVARLGERIERSEPAAAGDPPRLPGTRAAATAVCRGRDGIPLTPDLTNHLRQAARLLGKAPRNN